MLLSEADEVNSRWPHTRAPPVHHNDSLTRVCQVHHHGSLIHVSLMYTIMNESYHALFPKCAIET